MNRFNKGFTSFVNVSLKILLILALGQSLVRTFYALVEHLLKDWTSFLLISFIIIAAGGLYIYLINRALKAAVDHRLILGVIVLSALILRLIWVFAIQTMPVSDFSVIYESGRRFIEGDYSMFKGTGYIARFTHLTLSVIYYGIFHWIFSDPLISIKISNVILSTLNVLLIYLLVSEVYDSRKKGIWGAFAASIFPAFIMYTSVTCTENHAMSFFLGSVYIFLQVVKEKRSSAWLILSGVLLFTGHIFRMVGSVIIMAYIMYSFIYLPFRKSIKVVLYTILAFIIPLYITSTILLSLGITEYPLWKGREPASTSMLRGTNIKSNGAWNEEDAKIPEKYNYDYTEVDRAAKAIIKERLTTTPPLKLLAFYGAKFSSEWAAGDFASLYWSTLEVMQKNTAYYLSTFTTFYSQLIYSILFLSLYVGLFVKSQYMRNVPINLFYILYCGFALLYLITENQSRYGYIACWLFIVMAPTGFEKLNFAGKVKRINNKELEVRL